MTSPKGMSGAQKAIAQVALKWVVSKVTESYRQRTRKWRVKKTSRGWTVWVPGKLIPAGVYPTHAEAIAAINLEETA